MIKKIFYFFKPLIPRSTQLFLRRQLIRLKLIRVRKRWPIDENAAAPPPNWKGWPEGKKFGVILTHDVDTEKGRDTCLPLMELEDELGFKSSFNFIPEVRYADLPDLRKTLLDQGFEVGVHGLNHDGNLYRSKNIFDERKVKINKYLKEWNAVGFRSPAMHHQLEWIHDLNIEYDASTFDTDPFEPQPDGFGSIFPKRMEAKDTERAYIELPYTLAQDFTVLVLMKNNNIDIWKKKLDWIVQKGGMVLMNTHPDYMNFTKDKCGTEEFPVRLYRELLEYIKTKYKDEYWHGLPKDLVKYLNGKPS